MVRRQFIIMTTLICLYGCSSKPPSGSQFEMSGRQKMGELMELLSSAELVLKRPAANIKDLEKCGRVGSFALDPVRNGDFVIFYNVNLGQGDAVVAYEKDAPTQGGWVVLQNREIKKLTVDEFKAAPKAGKPSP